MPLVHSGGGYDLIVVNLTAFGAGEISFHPLNNRINISSVVHRQTLV